MNLTKTYMPRKSYVIDSPDGETSCRYAIFIKSELFDLLEATSATYDGRLELAEELTGWRRVGGSPSSWFWSEPSVRVTARSVIVCQHGG